MDELQIENEVKARMDFRLQQIISSLDKSADNLSSRGILHPQDPGYFDEAERYRELINLVERVWNEEMLLSMPELEMYVAAYTEKREELVEAITEPMNKVLRGKLNYNEESTVRKSVISNIEKALAWNTPDINIK